MSNPHIVVTGAAGFIGSRLLEELAKRHAAGELLAVDHPVTADKLINLSVAPTVSFREHRDFLRALETGEVAPDVIFHMGACSSTTETDWAYLAENNLVYSQRLWNWCAAHNSQFIYASSAATYGDGAQGFDDEADIRQLCPLNLYGKSKHDFDLWIADQLVGDKPRPRQSAGFKFFNVFGPGEAHKGRMASMAFHGWKQIQQGGAVRLFKSHMDGYEDGGQLRDFIYVRDVVEVLIATSKRPHVSGLFNLGTSQAHSFRQLIDALFAAMGREARIDYIPMPNDLRGKYQYFTEAAMRKLAKANIPYVPTSLASAVADYARWLAVHYPEAK